jgi:hypothetical protein
MVAGFGALGLTTFGNCSPICLAAILIWVWLMFGPMIVLLYLRGPLRTGVVFVNKVSSRFGRPLSDSELEYRAEAYSESDSGSEDDPDGYEDNGVEENANTDQ